MAEQIDMETMQPDPRYSTAAQSDIPPKEDYTSIQKPDTHRTTEAKVFSGLLVLALGGIIGASVYITTLPDEKEEIRNATEPLTTLERFELYMGEPVVDMKNFKNWDGSIEIQDSYMAAPSSLRELRQVVRAAIGLGVKVRASGGGYSANPLFGEEGTLIIDSSNLTPANKSNILEIKIGDCLTTVTVMAGVTVGDLARELVKKKYQIPVLPALQNAQLAGAVATGSYGGMGALGDYLMGVTLVDGKGQVKSFDYKTEPEELAALRCCVGMCGIFYKLQFKVEPLTKVSVAHQWIPGVDLFTEWFGKEILMSVDKGGFSARWFPGSSMTTPPYMPIEDHFLFKSHNSEINFNSSVQRDDMTDAQDDKFEAQWDKYTMARGMEYPVTTMALPASLANYNASVSDGMDSVAMVIMDDAAFNNSKMFMETTMSYLIGMDDIFPDVSVDISWMKSAANCYLCATFMPATADKDDLLFAVTISTEGLNMFPGLIEGLSAELEESFPNINRHWGYDMMTSLDGNQRAQNFRMIREKLDPDNLFYTTWLESMLGVM